MVKITNDNVGKIAKKYDTHTLLKSIRSKISDQSSGIERNSHAIKNKSVDLLWEVRNDPLLRSALEIKHSTISKVEYYWVGDVKESKLERLKSLRFHRWMEDSWWQELIYRNSFTELGRDSSSKVNNLSLIKTDEVEIQNDTHGKVLNYLQIPTNHDDVSPEDVIRLKKDDIIHISYSHLSTSLWGDSELYTALQVLKSKKLIEDFISWMFESNQFRTVIKIPEGIQDEDVDNYMEMIKAGMESPTNFLIVQGEEAQHDVLRKIEGFKELLTLLDYYRSQLLALLQLPPLQAGILESSNRSSSEYQVRYAFYTHIRSLLKRKEDEINNELLPSIGISKMKLKFSFIDDQARNDLLDSAQKLANMNANPKKLNKWLIDSGLNIPEDLLEEPPEPEGINGQLEGLKQNNGGSRLKLDKNSSLHPSRKSTEQNFSGGSRTK